MSYIITNIKLIESRTDGKFIILNNKPGLGNTIESIPDYSTLLK